VFDKSNKFDDKVMEFLACNESPNIIQNYLNIINNPPKDCIKHCKNVNELTKDHINRFFLVVVKHARNEITFNYIMRNFEEIKPR